MGCSSQQTSSFIDLQTAGIVISDSSRPGHHLRRRLLTPAAAAAGSSISIMSQPHSSSSSTHHHHHHHTLGAMHRLDPKESLPPAPLCNHCSEGQEKSPTKFIKQKRSYTDPQIEIDVTIGAPPRQSVSRVSAAAAAAPAAEASSSVVDHRPPMLHCLLHPAVALEPWRQTSKMCVTYS